MPSRAIAASAPSGAFPDEVERGDALALPSAAIVAGAAVIDSTGVAVVLTAVAGYLLGSIPVAVLVGRARGVDLRTVGDRNPGYWNAKEVLGRRAAIPVFAGDVVKGALAAGIGLLLGGPWWVGYVGGGRGDDRARVAGLRRLPRWTLGPDLRRRHDRAGAAPRRPSRAWSASS